jgi:antitoxin component YwqK of YwqJK toxin-antitoxin module
VEFLVSQIPDRYETDERWRYLRELSCDSVVGSFCSSKTFNHITDKNKLSNKIGIGLKYLDDKTFSDSIFYQGILFAGLMKVIDESGIKKIIDYSEGPLNRVEYDYDSSGALLFETRYHKGKEYISRFWQNGKISSQNVSPLIKINGTSESFGIDANRCFTWYSMVVRNDTSILNKLYTYSNVDIETFKISLNDLQGCNEIFEVNYHPGFVISRSEYITDCIIEIYSYETNFHLNRKIQSTGQYVYPATNRMHEKTNRTKIGEWKYYDLNNIIKKIITYDENGVEIECKGECN